MPHSKNQETAAHKTTNAGPTEDIGRMIGCISRVSHRHFNKELNKHDLEFSHAHMRIMRLLIDGLDGCHQDDLTKRLRKDKGTIARAVAQLEKEEFIYRRTDQNDHRANCIYTSEKSKKMYKEMEAIAYHWNQRLLDGFTKDETAKLKEYLERVLKNITSEESITHD